MPVDPLSVAIHEAGHAVVAVLRGIPLVRVGLTPGDPSGNDGVCLVEERSADTMTAVDLIDRAVMIAAGGVAQQLAGFPATGTGIDLENLAAVRWWYDRRAAGRPFPDVFALARADLGNTVAMAGVVALARRIASCGGMVGGAAARDTIRAGWRDRALVARIAG